MFILDLSAPEPTEITDGEQAGEIEIPFVTPSFLSKGGSIPQATQMTSPHHNTLKKQKLSPPSPT